MGENACLTEKFQKVAHRVHDGIVAPIADKFVHKVTLSRVFHVPCRRVIFESLHADTNGAKSLRSALLIRRDETVS